LIILGKAGEKGDEEKSGIFIIFDIF